MLGTVEIVTTIALSILVLCSLVGNTLVVLVVIRNRALRKPINLLIANLAVCDGLFAICLIPRFILIHTFEHPSGLTGDYLCRFFTGGSFSWIGGLASVYSLVTISCERFYAVTKPLVYQRQFNMKKAKRAAMVTWAASIAVNSPLFFVYAYDFQLKFCTESWKSAEAEKLYAIFWPIMAGPVPLGFIVYFYSRVIYDLWWKNKKKANITQQAVLRSRRRITKIAIAVTLIYFVTWFPGLVHNAFMAFDMRWFVPGSEVYRIFRVMTTFNSACNPFIYALQSQAFRKSVRKMLCKNHVGVRDTNSRLNTLGN